MLVVALVVACGRTDESVAPEKTASAERTDKPEPPGVATRFVGTEWTLTLLNGRELLDGTSVTLEIDREGGRIELGGTATCNLYGTGSATMRGGVLKSRGFDMTAMDCPGAKGRQEQAYIAALEDAATYRVRSDTLKVQDTAGETILVYSRERLTVSDPADLVGTRWVLRSIGGRAVAEGFTASVSFDSEKRLSGYDGCRHFAGRYVANESDLAVADFGYEVEEDYLKPGAHARMGPVRALENMPLEGKYSLDSGRLEVRGDSGAVSVYEPLRRGTVVEEPGPAWVLEKFVGEGEATPVLDGTEITLKFDRGTLRTRGTLSGSAGCNTYAADYEYGNDSFTSDTPVITAVTEKACYTPAGVMEQEQRYLNSLEDVDGFSTNIEGNLELFIHGDERKLVFAAKDS